MGTRSGWKAVGALAACVVTAPSVAAADLLRCQGPDGRMVYTDDRSVCPESQRYQPSATVQQEVSSPASVDPAARGRSQGRAKEEQTDAAQAAVWRQRKMDKEDELRRATSEYDYLKSYVAFCNHGNYVFTEDESGIKTQVSCRDLGARLAALDSRVQGLQDYLDRGLPDECRRAGCLPGWLR
ncbi:MAG TPA: DUF4124 domain-containing protein [Myxococcota bacterium]|nr:DUF4124 domain-containing protein [Myxococcota bacterium]